MDTNFSTEGLLPICQLVSIENDCLTLKEDNLHRLLEEFKSVDGIQDDLPIALLSAVGPPLCGKSFFTNLLIQFCKWKGEGGWTTTLRKGNQKVECAAGFQLKPGPPSNRLFNPNATSAGIFMWPEPFLIELHGRKQLVLILHIEPGMNGVDEEINKLELFLLLACSRMVEISVVGESLPVRLLNGRGILSENLPHEPKCFMCDNIAYILRSSKKFQTTYTDSESKKYLFEEIVQTDPAAAHYLADLKTVDIIHMKEIAVPLHDKDGFIVPQESGRMIMPTIKNVIRRITEDSAIKPKMQPDELTFKDILDFFKSCANVADAASQSKSCTDNAEGNEVSEAPELPSDISSQVECKPITALDFCKVKDNEMSPTEFITQNAIDLQKKMRAKNGEIVDEPEMETTPNADDSTGNSEASNHTLKLEQEVDKHITDVSNKAIDEMKSTLYSEAETWIKRDLTPDNVATADLLHDMVFASVTAKYYKEVDPEHHLEFYKAIKDYSMPYFEDYLFVLKTSLKDFVDAMRSQIFLSPSKVQSNFEVILGQVLSPILSSLPDDRETQRLVTQGCQKLAKVFENHIYSLNLRESKQIIQKPQNEQPDKEKFEKTMTMEWEQTKEDEGDLNKLTELVSEAVNRVKQETYSKTETWLLNNMTEENIVEISTLYERFSLVVLYDYDARLFNSQKDDFKNLVDKECKAIHTDHLANLQQNLLEFVEAIKRKVALHFCLPPDDFHKFSTDTFETICKKSDNSAVESLFKTGCSVLIRPRELLNIEVNKAEEKLAQAFQPELEQFYIDEMNEFVDNDVYDQSGLKNIHLKLVERITSAYATALRTPEGGENPNANVQKEVLRLKSDLDKKIKLFVVHNKANLEQRGAAIKNQIQKSQTLYKKQMEDVLKANPTGMSRALLEEKQNEISASVKKLMEMEIRDKVHKNEPMHFHLKSFQTYVDDQLAYFLDANENNEKMAKDRREREAGQTSSGANLKFEPTRTTFPNKTTITKFTNKQFKTESTTQPRENVALLPPLVFLLQSRRILMGMFKDRAKQLRNEWGQCSTPFTVALDNSGNLLYGNDAEDCPQSEKKFHWCVAEHFISDKNPFSETIQINGNSHRITVEFLLGLILKRLKSHVEKDMNGRCNSAVITVPIWFVGPQRHQVKLGAKLAGFEYVYLVNESSAAAFYSSSCTSLCEISHSLLVLSESKRQIDATIYYYNKDNLNISMVGHCASYCVDDDMGQHNSILGELKYAATSLLESFDKLLQINTQQPMLKLIEDVVRQALKSMKDPKYNNVAVDTEPVGILAISELSQWQKYMEKAPICKSKILHEIDAETAALMGAIVLSKDPNFIGEAIRDKLALPIIAQYPPPHAIEVVSGRENTLPLKNKIYPVSFHKLIKEVRICQRSPINSHVRIGSFRTDTASTYPIGIYLSVNNEGIAKFQQAHFSDYPQPGFHTPIQPGTGYFWVSTSLSVEDYNILESLLMSIKSPHEKQKVQEELDSKVRNQLLTQCAEMQGYLDRGDYKIRAIALKELVAKQIKKANDLASNLQIGVDQIQSQIESLALLHSKYNK